MSTHINNKPLKAGVSLLISFIFLVIAIILAYGWSKTNNYRLFWQQSDTTIAIITNKTTTSKSYFIAYTYHDNITRQGYADEKEVSHELWQTVSVGSELKITYNKKKPTQNILFTFTYYEVWKPFLQALLLSLILGILPAIVLLRGSQCFLKNL